MHGRVPATRHGKAIRLDLPLTACRGDSDLLKAQPPLCSDHAPTGDHRRIEGHARIGAAVDHRHHLDPRRHQIARRLMRAIVVAINRHALSRGHAPAIEIGPHGARVHDPRPVVVGESNRPLQRARRKDRPPRHDPPETLARQMPAHRLVQAHPLERPVGALIISAGHSRPRHQAHVVHAGEFGDHLGHPDMPWLAVDLFAFRQKASAHPAVLIGQDYIRPRPRRRQRRDKARRPRADHQKIAEGIGPLIAIRVVLARKRPKPRRAANERFIDLLPKRTRPHEGFVIEPRPKEWRRKVIDRQHIKPKARPAVLALHLKALVDLDHRRPQVRLRPRARPGRHQRIRLLAPRRQNAPRPVILERPRHQPDIIGQKRRGNRIAFRALDPPPIERKRNPLRRINQPLARDPHLRTSEARSPLCTAWVTVSRCTTIQAPQGS